MDKIHQILIIDNAGQRKWETIKYNCVDMRDEIVHITEEGLQYSRDSLTRKRQHYLIDRLNDLCKDLAHSDIVIWDPSVDEKDTLLYYRRVYFQQFGRHQLICLVVKVRDGIKYLYNIFLQQSSKVKGYETVPADAYDVWYLAPNTRPKQYGIKG